LFRKFELQEKKKQEKKDREVSFFSNEKCK
jgi:hypothetical protein